MKIRLKSSKYNENQKAKIIFRNEHYYIIVTLGKEGFLI